MYDLKTTIQTFCPRCFLNNWFPLVILFFLIGATLPCEGMAFFMKTGLSDKESRQLDDINTFNQSIQDVGWSLKRKIIRKKNLDHLKLKDSKWYDVTVALSSFKEAVFKNCTFEKVSFDQSSLGHAAFEGCQFIACSFRNSNLMDASYSSSVFKECSFEASDLSGTSLIDTSFHNLKATEVEWRHARLEKVRFVNCDLNEVDITDGQLANILFESCRLLRSGFSNNRIDDATFDIQGDFVSFAESKATNMTITSPAAINDLNLSGITGSQIIVKNLLWSEMFSISLGQVDHFRMENAKLRYASITGTTFANAIFKNIQFAYARFDRSRYAQTRFENVEFSGEIIFDDAEFENTEFSAIQRGHDLTVSFKNTVFENKPPF